jgi:hypothetical protein
VEAVRILGKALMRVLDLDHEVGCCPSQARAVWATCGQWKHIGLVWSYVHQKWASRRFGPRLLVGLWHEDTYHVGNQDLSFG